MQIIAAYVGEIRHVLEDSGQILSRANQALATLERYKLRLDEVSSTLSALEIEDLVTVRDVAVVAQRLEMVTRIAREIEDYVLELGTDGRLLSLQLEELVTGVDAERELVVRDYLPAGRAQPRAPRRPAGPARGALPHRPGRPGRRRPGARPRRRRAPRRRRRPARLPAAGQGAAAARARVVDRLVEHFGTLQKLLSAGVDDLQAVDGVGELRARSVREGLSRLAESSDPRALRLTRRLRPRRSARRIVPSVRPLVDPVVAAPARGPAASARRLVLVGDGLVTAAGG